MREFGGTSAHWEGFCRPLGRKDFTARDWVPDSGWPIDYDTLVPYYRSAHETLQVGRLDWHTYPGSHHMSGTRMGDDPNTSVVDTNLRCHDVSNLYVVGSSVYVTAGDANPTLTIVALAHRLADHLRERCSLSRKPPSQAPMLAPRCWHGRRGHGQRRGR